MRWARVGGGAKKRTKETNSMTPSMFTKHYVQHVQPTPQKPFYLLRLLGPGCSTSMTPLCSVACSAVRCTRLRKVDEKKRTSGHKAYSPQHQPQTIFAFSQCLCLQLHVHYAPGYHAVGAFRGGGDDRDERNKQHDAKYVHQTRIFTLVRSGRCVDEGRFLQHGSTDITFNLPYLART